jgi:RimJ/RimL family protein N-acetyltransferase
MIRRKISLLKTRIVVATRDFGIKHTILRMLQDGLLSKFFLFRQYIIYEKQLPKENLPELRNPHLEFSFISPDDNETLEKIEQLSGLSHNMVAEKIRNGGECVVARDDGKLAGFNLASIGKAHVRYLDAYLDLSQKEAWSEQITVAPEFRQGGLATDIRHKMFERLVSRGYEKLIGGYVPFNQKSAGLAKKLGFIEKEKFTLIRIIIWKKLYSQKMSPDIMGELALAFQ